MGLLYRHLYLPFFDAVMGLKPIRKQREKVVPRARGHVLEIGVGTGHNLKHYDHAHVEKLVALDPDADARRLAERRAREAGVTVDWMTLEAERIPLADESVDSIVITYTMCTIGDPGAALGEMRRVLKPGGEMFFSEHGRSPDPEIVRWQDRLTPTWKVIADGCHLNRDIPALLKEAGFAVPELDTMYVPGTWRPLGYTYWGRATRA